MTLYKDYPLASFKALPGEGEGTFEAVVSVIGNVDLQGDRVESGAFDKSIAKWKSSGNPLPVLWSHDWGDPFAHIGYVDPADMKEIKGNQKAGIPAGLYVKGHLDVHKPFAKQVYDLLSERRVTEFSFSYDIPPGGESRGKDGANELHTVDLIEVGPTLKGANPMTVSLGTKSAVNTEDERRVKARLDHAADAELRMAIEKASWNGDAAMQSCHTAADFRKIAFERANDSDPDTAAHWALPHHSSPGADANPAGVAAALAALHGARGGAPDLKNKAAAESHLKAHSGVEKAFDPNQPRDANGRWMGAPSSDPLGLWTDNPDDTEKELDRMTNLNTVEELAGAIRTFRRNNRVSGEVDDLLKEAQSGADAGDFADALTNVNEAIVVYQMNRNKADFTPSLHPRDSQGRFTDSPGGGGRDYRAELIDRPTEDLRTIANAPGALPDVRRIASDIIDERGGADLSQAELARLARAESSGGAFGITFTRRLSEGERLADLSRHEGEEVVAYLYDQDHPVAGAIHLDGSNLTIGSTDVSPKKIERLLFSSAPKSAEKAGNAGNASSLIRWFNEGAGGAIAWGSPGDWSQCVAVASAHMGVEDAKGFCQNRHQEATGMSTAEHAHQEGKEYDTPDGQKFDPNQIRDRNGRWTDSPGGGVGTGAGAGGGGYAYPLGTQPSTTPSFTPSESAATRLGRMRPYEGQWVSTMDEPSGQTHAEGYLHVGDSSFTLSGSDLGTQELDPMDVNQFGVYDVSSPTGGSSVVASFTSRTSPEVRLRNMRPYDGETMDALRLDNEGQVSQVLASGVLHVGDSSFTVGGVELDPMSVDQFTRYGKPKKSAKAGRMIGASAAQTIKEHVMTALDECFKELNGSGDYSEEKLAAAVLEKLGAQQLEGKVTVAEDADAKLRDLIEQTARLDPINEDAAREQLGLPPKPEYDPEPEDTESKKQYARGYADGNMGRGKAEGTEADIEYHVGYAAGEKDRAESDRSEITKFEEQFAQLEIKK